MQTIVTHRICSSFEIANPRPFRGAGLYQNGHKPTAFASLWAIMRLSTAALITNTFEEATRRLCHPQQNDVASRVRPIGRTIAGDIRAGGCRPWLNPRGGAGF